MCVDASDSSQHSREKISGWGHAAPSEACHNKAFYLPTSTAVVDVVGGAF